MWLREPWRTRLLFLSVAGNLVALALLVSHLATHRGHGPPGLEGVVERMARNLPPADAAAFRAVLDRERPWYQQARRRLDDSQANLARSIARDPYDEDAVRQSLQALQAGLQETSGRFNDSLLAAIGVLSPEGRTRLAESSRHPGRP